MGELWTPILRPLDLLPVKVYRQWIFYVAKNACSFRPDPDRCPQRGDLLSQNFSNSAINSPPSQHFSGLQQGEPDLGSHIMLLATQFRLMLCRSLVWIFQIPTYHPQQQIQMLVEMSWL